MITARSTVSTQLQARLRKVGEGMECATSYKAWPAKDFRASHSSAALRFSSSHGAGRLSSDCVNHLLWRRHLRTWTSAMHL